MKHLSEELFVWKASWSTPWNFLPVVSLCSKHEITRSGVAWVQHLRGIWRCLRDWAFKGFHCAIKHCLSTLWYNYRVCFFLATYSKIRHNNEHKQEVILCSGEHTVQKIEHLKFYFVKLKACTLICLLFYGSDPHVLCILTCWVPVCYSFTQAKNAFRNIK